jgi:hypothetical protein
VFSRRATLLEDAVAGDEQYVHLARVRGGGDLVSKVDELVGAVAHGADGDDDVVGGGARGDDALRDPIDALGVGDGGPTGLLHDEVHGGTPEMDGGEGNIGAPHNSE